MNSSIVYSIVLTSTVFHEHNEAFMIGCDHIIKERYREWPWLLRFLMVLPFSQLAPAGTYMFHTFIMPHWRKTAIRRSGLSDLRGKTHKLLGGQTAVHRKEADAVQGTFTVVGRLQDAVKRQVVTHGMLFAETIVESIPQSIIQLLAITFLGAPSTLQVVSMALSILSVVSKAYFLSLSACLRVFVFKFSVLSFDVLSMFYIFSTILSKERSQDVGLFGSDSLRVRRT